MNALDTLRRELRPGRVYRRVQLAQFSGSVDRHLKQLVMAGELQKLETGVYYKPKKSMFGDVPPEEDKLLEAFLNSDDFLVMSLNTYNAMGLGTTQLYNERLVYNHKRDGHMTVNGQNYFFIKNRKFPKTMSEEFLLVDLMNNMDLLAENTEKLKDALADKVFSMEMDKVKKAVNAYGKARAAKFFRDLEKQDFANA